MLLIDYSVHKIFIFLIKTGAWIVKYIPCQCMDIFIFQSYIGLYTVTEFDIELYGIFHIDGLNPSMVKPQYQYTAR